MIASAIWGVKLTRRDPFLMMALGIFNGSLAHRRRRPFDLIGYVDLL